MNESLELDLRGRRRTSKKDQRYDPSTGIHTSRCSNPAALRRPEKNACRGIGNRVGQPKRRQLFKTKMGRLGCSWAELGRCTADCGRQPSVPIANSRPRRNRPILLRTKTISRLARSWAEFALA